MEDCLCLLASIFLLLFFCSNKSYVYGARELADRHDAQEVKSLMPSLTCSPSTNKGLQIAHRYGPCSPLSEENPRPSYREILLQDQSRVRALNSISSSMANDFVQGTQIPLGKNSMGNGNYVVKVGFGTPKRDLTLMFDTGSSITWIQCKPCDNCYEQDEDIFDPSQSSTFSNATCVNSTGTCQYSQHYHDKSYSHGYYVRDTLTISNVAVNNFVFGCGRNNSDDKFGRVAGLLGCGLEDTSLMSQAITQFNKMFCYCLPSTESSTGYVVFGIDALATCNPERTTPLLSDPNHYFVGLAGITIGQQRLDTPSNSGSSTRVTIDSGTIISRLPKSVYSQLRSSFQKSMSQYDVAEPVDVMDTCYNLRGDQNSIPSMTLHFDDSVDLNLDPSAVVFKDPDSQATCLAFAENDRDGDLTIIGNHQHRNIKIYYDIYEEKVGFSTGGCGN